MSQFSNTDSSDIQTVETQTYGNECTELPGDSFPVSLMVEDDGNVQGRQSSMELNTNNSIIIPQVIDIYLVSQTSTTQEEVSGHDATNLGTLGLQCDGKSLELTTDLQNESNHGVIQEISTTAEEHFTQQNFPYTEIDQSKENSMDKQENINDENVLNGTEVCHDTNIDNTLKEYHDVDDSGNCSKVEYDESSKQDLAIAVSSEINIGNTSTNELDKLDENASVTCKKEAIDGIVPHQKSGPIFHGLKGKPVNMGSTFKSKKSQNLFENLLTFIERNKSLELKENDAVELADDDDQSDNDESEDSNLQEDTLINNCLKTKAVIQLETLDLSKIPQNIRIVASESTLEQEAVKQVSEVIVSQPLSEANKKVVSKTEPKFGKYGKKKKNKKMSAKLLREIDKQPAKRFKKVPAAEQMWKKIVKNEKMGLKMKGRKSIKGVFPCDKCDYVAKQQSHLVAHKSVHSLKFVKCKYCKYETRSESKLMEHEARHTGDKPFKCHREGCDYAGICKQDLNKHQRKHLETKPFKCPHCDFVTKWPRNIQSHLLTHTDERPYSCKICGYAFKRSCDLKYHMYRHNNSKPIKCDQCDFRCKTNFEIKCHMLKHSDVRYFKCTHPGCTQETKTKSDLTKHMKVHCKSLDFVCDLCGKAFKTKCSLRKHMLRHSNERPWKCDICGRGFKLKPALRNHINMHANYKPHACDFCGMLFASLGNKRTHMVVHSAKDRPLRCPICPYLGKTQEHILAHIGTMHGSQYAYFCEICKKPFKRYHLLQMHYPRCHTKEEMALMENALKLNIQAIKSEAIDEISNAELAKKNADMNWDCIIIKDERDDTLEDKKCKSNSENADISGNDVTNEDKTLITVQQNIESHGGKDSASADEKENDNKNFSMLANTVENDMPEIKPAKQELYDNSFGPDKPATIAIYDGFRLPLATVGFSFNFIKKGKKTKAWFMDSKYMDETARERHNKYLRKKQEHGLYGYYSSKRRRRINGKLTSFPVEIPKKGFIKREFAGGRFVPKMKGDINSVKNFITGAMSRIVKEPTSKHALFSYNKKSKEKKTILSSIREPKLTSSFKQVKTSRPITNSKPYMVYSNEGSAKSKSVKLKGKLGRKPKGSVLEKPHKKMGRPAKASSLSETGTNILTSQYVKPKGKPGRPKKIIQVLNLTGHLELNSETGTKQPFKMKGKPGRKPKGFYTLPAHKQTIKPEGTTWRKPKIFDNSISTENEQPKGKLGRKSKIHESSNSTGIAQPKKKRGRPPKLHTGSNDISILNTQPKGKPGRKPKFLTSITPSPIIKFKKKPGRKPKNYEDISSEEIKIQKGKPGRKPKVINVQEQSVKVKGKPGRKPSNKNMIVATESVKPKGKPGRKPKAKNEIISVKILKPKGKPGRKPKYLQHLNQETSENTPILNEIDIKQEATDDFDQVTATIDDLLSLQGDSSKDSQPRESVSACPNNIATTSQSNENLSLDPFDITHSDITADSQDFENGNDSLSDRIKTMKRKLNPSSSEGLQVIKRKKPNMMEGPSRNRYDQAHEVLISDKDSSYVMVYPDKRIKYKYCRKKNVSSSAGKMGDLLSEPKKRGRPKKTPEVIIENAEEANSVQNVFPVSLHSADNYSLPLTGVIVKEEINITINQESELHSKDDTAENGPEADLGTNEDLPDSSNNVLEQNLNPTDSVVPYCDDVVAMRMAVDYQIDGESTTGNETRSYDRNLNINETLSVQHLGIRIEKNKQDKMETSIDKNLEVENDNVIVQLVEPTESVSENILFRLEEEDINESNTLSENIENSSPIKDELVETERGNN